MLKFIIPAIVIFFIVLFWEKITEIVEKKLNIKLNYIVISSVILIYIKDNSPDKGIVIEDKSNEEKNFSHEFKPSEIFKASDMMVDSLTQLLERERSKKDN